MNQSTDTPQWSGPTVKWSRAVLRRIIQNVLAGTIDTTDGEAKARKQGIPRATFYRRLRANRERTQRRDK